MTDRRTFVQAGALALLSVPLCAAAQRPATMPRIGFLTPGTYFREQAFWEAMRALGYVEGKNIVVDRRSAEGDFARLPALAAEIVKNRPDIIVAIVSAAALAAKEATSTIPIVFVGVSDPVASGLVGNLARPGGNVTGTSDQSHTAVGKEFELIRQLLPKARRVVALWNPGNANFQQLMVSEAFSAAARLQMLLRLLEVQTQQQLDRTFTALGGERPDAVVVMQDTFFGANLARIVELALAQRLPAFSGGRPFTEGGLLASYGSDAIAVSRRAAAYVQKILNGAKPGDLAVELPTKFELVINLKTAKALGITVPQSLLLRADEVIQ
jgi:putative tryptophan/tyrosine transport system substrate-binding protein